MQRLARGKEPMPSKEGCKDQGGWGPGAIGRPEEEGPGTDI